MARNLIDWHLEEDDVWSEAIDAALRHGRSPRWSDKARERCMALLFFNPSLRTRASMEMACVQLGAHATTMNAGQGVWGFEWKKGTIMDGDTAEHIVEAIGVLSRYYDALGVRVFASLKDRDADRKDQMLNTIVEAATVPVVNLESAFYHPCQALGDAATLMAHFKEHVKGRRFLLTWAYHPRALPQAVPNSALLMASRLGMEVTLAHPPGYELEDSVMRQAEQYASANGTTVRLTQEDAEAFDEADVVYAKAWAGSGIYTDPEAESVARNMYRHWRVTVEKMRRTREAAFMHCLPVRRNVVVDDAVLDSRQAIHLQQAEFRLHAQKAVLEYIWNL